MEFPEPLLERAFFQGSHDAYVDLRDRAQISPCLALRIESLLTAANTSSLLQEAAAGILGRHSRMMSDSAISFLVCQKGKIIYREWYQSLADDPNPPENVLRAVASTLTLKYDIHVEWPGWRIPADLFKRLIVHELPAGRLLAAKAIATQCPLQQDIIADVVALLKSPDWIVQTIANRSLDQVPDLPPDVLRALSLEAALRILAFQSTLPNNIRDSLVSLVLDGGVVFDSSNLSTFVKHLQTDQNIISIIVTFVSHIRDSHEMENAGKTLCQYTTFAQDIRQKVASRITQGDNQLMPYEAFALSYDIVDLTEETLRLLVTHMEDWDPRMTRAIDRCLERQFTLSSSLLPRLVTYLKHGEPTVRKSALKALKHWRVLAEDVLDILSMIPAETNGEVQVHATIILASQCSLPGRIARTLFSHLKVVSMEKGPTLWRLLGREENLPATALDLMVSLYHHDMLSAQHGFWEFARLIASQECLSDNVVRSIAGLFGVGDPIAWPTILNLLRQRTSFGAILSDLDAEIWAKVFKGFFFCSYGEYPHCYSWQGWLFFYEGDHCFWKVRLETPKHHEKLQRAIQAVQAEWEDIHGTTIGPSLTAIETSR
ncbi:hypothetical protein ASPZODRAFT_18655 [Penicilliopsis zonata CBS 506.65]|uniref:ARM repeat-containing protein n=1 Tax=Penicilliopsis zonata CBS 506.65 TaxID=1073090 RepID=A0A1L9SBA8_9EURO|nr:hypothetical protein ASPZODRAFT_18655 [Penicilliopsis zonata CBS 506.65]OJJ44463.1 hypothetical protein ASPZODRAFT_18655 [Penicilliopsis zonata CBS 506.65]